MVTWDEPSGTTLTVQELRSKMQAVGINPDHCADLRPTSVFSRATSKLEGDRAIDRVERTKDGKVTFQLTAKKIQFTGHGKEMTYNKECKLTLDTDTGDITGDDQTMVMEARRLYATVSEVRTSSDLTKLIKLLFKMNGDIFPLTKKGVVYFVPAPYEPFVDKMKNFMDQLGAKIVTVPIDKPDPNIPATQHTANGIRDAVEAGMKQLYNEMDQTIENWNDKTRKKTKQKHNDELKVLMHKADCYREYLQNNMTEINAKAHETKNKLFTKLQELGDMEEATNPGEETVPSEPVPAA
jgi:hypothetical protein